MDGMLHQNNLPKMTNDCASSLTDIILYSDAYVNMLAKCERRVKNGQGQKAKEEALRFDESLVKKEIKWAQKLESTNLSTTGKNS
jgi:hypothetical protein